MTKIIAIVTLVWWNPNTGTIDETTYRFANVGANLTQCERTIEMEAFWLAVDGHTPNILMGPDGSYENVGAKAECVVWREA